MASGLFGSILEELSKKIGIPLQPDHIGSCLVKFANGLDMQLDLDKNNQLLVGIFVTTLPVGKYRTEVFKQALCANSMREEANGVFGFSSRKDILVLFEILPGESVNPDQLFKLITSMMLKAQTWKTAIASGDIPPVDIKVPADAQALGSLFGLK
jgi:hypothetical protein